MKFYTNFNDNQTELNFYKEFLEICKNHNINGEIRECKDWKNTKSLYLDLPTYYDMSDIWKESKKLDSYKKLQDSYKR